MTIFKAEFFINNCTFFYIFHKKDHLNELDDQNVYLI